MSHRTHVQLLINLSDEKALISPNFILITNWNRVIVELKPIITQVTLYSCFKQVKSFRCSINNKSKDNALPFVVCFMQITVRKCILCVQVYSFMLTTRKKIMSWTFVVWLLFYISFQLNLYLVDSLVGAYQVCKAKTDLLKKQTKSNEESTTEPQCLH